MIGTRSALFAATLLAAAPAVAAQSDGGHYLSVLPAATAVLVPSAPVAPIGFPAARMIGDQQALMNRIFADIDLAFGQNACGGPDDPLGAGRHAAGGARKVS